MTFVPCFKFQYPEQAVIRTPDDLAGARMSTLTGEIVRPDGSGYRRADDCLFTDFESARQAVLESFDGTHARSSGRRGRRSVESGEGLCVGVRKCIRSMDIHSGPVVWCATIFADHLVEVYHPDYEHHNSNNLQQNATVNQEYTGKKNMVKLKIKRESGKLMLYVDAAELHATLDSVGAQHEGQRYTDRPATGVSVVDTTRHVVSTEVLLTREYPAKFNLTECYVANPPSMANLKKLCESAYEQTRKVLEHYQPIDISIEIHKKLVKND